MVAPAPFYKIWQLDEGVLLNDPNVIYTFDFFLPWPFITNDTGMVNHRTFPGEYACNDIFKGWVEKMCPEDHNAVLYVDKNFFFNLLLEYPLRLSEVYSVPVYCKQWGIKHLVPEENGRQQYLQDISSLFEEAGVHSTYWIWRSYHKDLWTGFEVIYYEEFDKMVLEELTKAWNRSIH